MIKNPFIYGKIVKGDQFADREAERDELVRTLTSGENVVLYSPRRYGKSSLAAAVSNELKEKDVPVGIIDMEYISTKTALAEYIVSATHGAFHPMRKEFFDRLSDLKDYLPSITVKPFEELPMTIEFESPSVEEGKALKKALQLPEIYASKKGKTMVIIIDEFPFVVQNIGGDILNLLRGIMQDHTYVSYLFLGSSRSMMRDIFDTNTSPFYKFGKKMTLDVIPKEDFAEFIKDNFPQGTISEGSIQQILDTTRCHPYYTQQLCHELWDMLTVEEEKEVTEDLLESAMERVLSSEKGVYLEILDSLPGTQMRILKAIAEGWDTLYSKNSLRELNMSSATAQKAVKGLIKKDVVTKKNGDPEVEDPFFAVFVKRNVR